MSTKFKSSGFRSTSRKFNKKSEPNRVPVGISTPMVVGNDTLFNMHFSVGAQLKDNFRNMILTNKGERLGRPDFGCSLQDILFDLSSDQNFEEIAMQKIKEQAGRYIPGIVLDTFEMKTNNNERAVASLTLIITYSVPRAGIQKDILEVNLRAGG